jgi:hypothetical protein
MRWISRNHFNGAFNIFNRNARANVEERTQQRIAQLLAKAVVYDKKN